MAKTWQDKLLHSPPAHVSLLDKACGGVAAGGRLFIATPLLIQQQIAAIPHGRTLSVADIRSQLARSHHADSTCPLTTGIFLRIVAEAAWDELNNGSLPGEVTPFWRAIDPESALAGKLRCGRAFIRHMLQLEARHR